MSRRGVGGASTSLSLSHSGGGGSFTLLSGASSDGLPTEGLATGPTSGRRSYRHLRNHVMSRETFVLRVASAILLVVSAYSVLFQSAVFQDDAESLDNTALQSNSETSDDWPVLHVPMRWFVEADWANEMDERLERLLKASSTQHASAQKKRVKQKEVDGFLGALDGNELVNNAAVDDQMDEELDADEQALVKDLEGAFGAHGNDGNDNGNDNDGNEGNAEWTENGRAHFTLNEDEEQAALQRLKDETRNRKANSGIAPRDTMQGRRAWLEQVKEFHTKHHSLVDMLQARRKRADLLSKRDQERLMREGVYRPIIDGRLRRSIGILSQATFVSPRNRMMALSQVTKEDMDMEKLETEWVNHRWSASELNTMMKCCPEGAPRRDVVCVCGMSSSELLRNRVATREKQNKGTAASIVARTVYTLNDVLKRARVHGRVVSPAVRYCVGEVLHFKLERHYAEAAEKRVALAGMVQVDAAENATAAVKRHRLASELLVEIANVTDCADRLHAHLRRTPSTPSDDARASDDGGSAEADRLASSDEDGGTAKDASVEDASDASDEAANDAGSM